MAQTCRYHTDGQYVHAEVPATHVVMSKRTRVGLQWDVYQASSGGGAGWTPEFCLTHALEVATARKHAMLQAREKE